MKTKSLTILLFTLFFFSGFSQEQLIKLKLKEGHEYVFKTTKKQYGLRKDNTKEVYFTQEKETQLYIEKFIPDQEAIISVNFLEYTDDRSSSSGLINKHDFFYPEYSYQKSPGSYSDLFEMFLCRNGIKFSIDLNSREIKVLESVGLLEKYYNFLKTQDFKENELKDIIEYTSQNILPDQEYLVSHLVWFHNSKINAENLVTNSLLDDKLKTNQRGKEFLAFSDMDFENLIPGKTYKKYWIEPDNGIVTHYTTFQRDSAHISNFELYGRVWNVHETNSRLLHEKPLPKDVLAISGKIETPLSNKIYIKYLNKPCGVEMKTKTILLDENGYFNTTLDFSNGCFVYVENENKNKHFPPKTYVFYAEPGDTIGFEAKGKKQPWNVSFSGTRIEESKLIEEIRKEILVITDTTPSSKTRILFDDNLSFDLYLINGKFDGEEKLNSILTELKNIEKIIEKYNTEIENDVLDFIQNETKNYIYAGLFQFFRNNINRQFYISLENGSARPISKYDYNIQAPDFKELKDHLDQLNIHDIYNNYGLYSRKLAGSYFEYHFSKTNKIQVNYVSVGEIYINDIENSIEFMRLIFTGSVLYHEIASVLKGTFISTERSNTELAYSTNNNYYFVNAALENIELLTKRCNNMTLVSYMNEVVSQYKKLKTDNFLPEMTFLNLDKKNITFKDFAGDKPTLFCVSEGWGHYRYQFDDYAKENPDINFVMVCENSSFDNWKDYTQRAEPIAEQLLFVNDSISISDVFQAPYVYFVLDKKGNMAGFARDTKDGIKKARATLVPLKKELNKSQLKLIILALVIVITIFSLGFLLWKWRVRLRFKKEQQFRKLKELELTAIRSQMNPHFLFNCLNSVQNLIQQNKGGEAHLYLADFAGLIRKVLQNSEKEEVSLEEELEMTKQYLNLEKLRFEFDFTVSVDDGIDANNTMVPSLLLQPFAENAIIHGLQNKTGNRRLNIEVDRISDGIRIIIEDNGVGRKAAKQIATEKNGKGSKLMKERLEILQQKHGEKYQLNIFDIEGDATGTKVEIIIPEEK